MKTKKIVVSAMMAAIYYVMTVAISPLSYGSVQLRVSEIMLIFCMHNPCCVFGYAAGCALANLTSPLGILDVIVGSSANLVCGMIAYKVKRIRYILAVAPVINGIVVGAELSFVYGTPFIMNSVTVAIGEFAALLIGAVVYKSIGKRIESIMM